MADDSTKCSEPEKGEERKIRDFFYFLFSFGTNFLFSHHFNKEFVPLFSLLFLGFILASTCQSTAQHSRLLSIGLIGHRF